MWDQGQPYVEELTSGIYAYVQPTGGWMVNNCGVITNAAGVSMLVDTAASEARTRALLASVSEVGAQAPLLAVNTHHHPDHTYGNGFLPEGATILGHRLAREGILRAGLAATAEFDNDFGHLTVRPPTVTFSETVTVHLDEVTVDLIPMGPAHTVDDVAVWLPDQQVLFAGDLIFSGAHPIFVEGSLRGFGAALERIRALAPDALVPGHGPARRGDQVGQVLDALAGYVEYIAELATTSYAAGRSPLEAAIRDRDNPYASWAEGERVVANLHRAYVELTDYESTTALTIPSLWNDMAALNGGPIVSHL